MKRVTCTLAVAITTILSMAPMTLGQWVGGMNGPYSNPQTTLLSLDPAESSLLLTPDGLPNAPLRAEFKPILGTVAIGRPNTLAVYVDVSKLSTGDVDLDARLKSAQFLNESAHPRIELSATVEERDAESGATVFGKFSIGGVEKDVPLIVAMNATRGDPARCTLVADLSIRLAEFGLAALEPHFGDQMHVHLVVSGLVDEYKLPRGGWWIRSTVHSPYNGDPMKEEPIDNPPSAVTGAPSVINSAPITPSPVPLPSSVIPAASLRTGNPMDDMTRLMIFGLALPAVLGALVGLMGARGAAMQPGQHAAPAPGRALVGVITAIVLTLAATALLLAQYGVHGGISWPPVSADDRLRLVPGAILLICILALLARVPMSTGATLIAFLGGATGAAIIGGKQWFAGSLAPYGSVVWLPIAFGAWGALTAFPLSMMAARGQRVSAGIILIGLGAAVAAGLIGTGSIELGKHGFAITAILIGLVAASLFMRSAVRPMTTGIMCAALAALMAHGVIYSSTPWWTAAALACVPLSALIADHLFARRLSPRTAAIIRIAVAATVAAAAIAPGIKSLIDFITASDTHQSE